MNNSKYIRGAFDEIHAPNALLRKVKTMNKKEAKKNYGLKYAITALAGFAFVFVASNSICYAATGETLVEKAYVYINGEAYEADIEWSQDGDTLVGQVSYDVSDGEEVSIQMTNEITPDSTYEDNSDFTYSYDSTYELIEEDGKIYLVVNDNKVDITEDFSDGEASGTIKCNDETVNFVVSGTIDEYEIFLEN